jgi:tyrosine-protein kinase Etk/Wzc
MSADQQRGDDRFKVLAVTNPNDPAIESLRSLRTSLQFALLKAKNNIIVITSSGPNDGKSFVSINLGAVLASTGKRILVIDTDLRRGSFHQYFGMDHEGGMTDVIAGDMGIEQVIRESGIDNLFLITTGTLPPNPSELLLHGRFGFALEQISPNFDYVIIDTPPILAVTDATTISSLAGATFLVVKSGMHPIRELDHAVKRLRNSGSNVRGIVLNEIQSFSSRYGYGKNYGYAYNYSHARK